MGIATLSSDLWVLEGYGPVAPSTLTGPVRQGRGKYGDGLFVEEGTTNLFPNPSFETGTTGVAAQGTAPTFAVSTTRCRFGSQSLLITWPTAASGASGAVQTVTVATGSQAVSIDVWVPTGSAPVAVQVVAGTATFTVTTASGSSTVNDAWQRLTAIINVTGAGTVQVGLVTAAATTSSHRVWTDSWQVEAKAYATSYCDGSLGNGYAWTGTAHASSSTRTASRVTLTSPRTLAGPFTICAWVRVGAAGLQNAIRALIGLPTSATTPVLMLTPTTVRFSNTFDAAATVSYTSVPGDLLFVAGTVAADGKTFTVSASINGAAVTSATSAASASAYGGSVSVGVGGDSAGANPCDSVIEQVLAYSVALTAAEITALATRTDETNCATDTRIVLAAATGTVRGTTQAETASGTGSWRGRRKVTSRLEQIAATSSSPDDDTATHKITVPAGSGIAAGESVAYNLDGSNGTRFLISRASSPGGVDDELYATNVL